ncbi:PIG-L family deacetylase [Streptomyces aureus]
MRRGRRQDKRDQNAEDGIGGRIADGGALPCGTRRSRAPGRTHRGHRRRRRHRGRPRGPHGHDRAPGPRHRPLPASGRPAAQGDHALLLQVLAHPDDDLYFMNPDTSQAVATGIPLVCVYVTAGEADGVNKIPGRPHPRPTSPRTPPPVTRGSASPMRPSSACRSSPAGAPRSPRSRAGTRPR